MQQFFVFNIILTMGCCASYQRYGDSPQYPPYSTVSSVYNPNQYPYKTNYGTDIATLPDSNRYLNYKPGPTSSNVYNDKVNYQSAYSTPNYGSGYGYNSQTYGQGISGYELPFSEYNSNNYCSIRSPQHGISVNDLSGMWYGVELIQHLSGGAGVEYVRTCIVIHISEPLEKPSTENQLFHVQSIMAKFNQQYRHLRLLWNENGQTAEYSLFFRNESAGYWETFDKQNGTMAARPHYQQFSGTIQVLKAVNDHLVLNFCQSATAGGPAQLYSVLFSREIGSMPQWEINAVHSLLQNKNLSIASRRLVCGNGADRPILSLLFSLISCTLAYATLL